MSKQANKTLIGMFVLGAVVLLVVAIVVLGSGSFFKKTIRGVCYFEGSVGGLNVGAPVVFRGVKIGMVSDINLRYDAEKRSVLIPVYVKLEQGQMGKVASYEEKRKEFHLLIEKGLRARLEMQSFVTGQLQVGLDFYPDRPARFVRADSEDLEFPTIPTPIQEISKKLEELPLADIIRKFDATMDGLARVVNSPEISNTLKSMSEAAKETQKLVHNLEAKVRPVLAGTEETVKDVRRLIQNVDAKFGSSVAQMDETAKEIQKLALNAQSLTQEVKGALQNANAQIQPLFSGAQETMAEAKRAVRDIDTRMAALSDQLEGAVKDVRQLVKNVDGQIEPIGNSFRSTLASIERTSGEAAATLRATQQTLGAADGMGEEDSELLYGLRQTLKEVKAAARAIRDLADTLEQQPQSPFFGKKTILRR